MKQSALVEDGGELGGGGLRQSGGRGSRRDGWRTGSPRGGRGFHTELGAVIWRQKRTTLGVEMETADELKQAVRAGFCLRPSCQNGEL